MKDTERDQQKNITLDLQMKPSRQYQANPKNQNQPPDEFTRNIPSEDIYSHEDDVNENDTREFTGDEPSKK